METFSRSWQSAVPRTTSLAGASTFHGIQWRHTFKHVDSISIFVCYLSHFCIRLNKNTGICFPPARKFRTFPTRDQVFLNIKTQARRNTCKRSHECLLVFVSTSIRCFMLDKYDNYHFSTTRFSPLEIGWFFTLFLNGRVRSQWERNSFSPFKLNDRRPTTLGPRKIIETCYSIECPLCTQTLYFKTFRFLYVVACFDKLVEFWRGTHQIKRS